MKPSYTLEELEVLLGENLRNLRLNRNIDQKTLSARAGVSCRALQNLEAGAGSTIKTLIAVVRTLDREDWLDGIAPATINPLTMLRTGTQRQRAGRKPRKPMKSTANVELDAP